MHSSPFARGFRSRWLLVSLLTLCLGGSRLWGQGLGDSTAVPMRLQQELFESQVASPIGVQLLPRASFGYTSLTYSQEWGDLVPVQHPERERRLDFRSTGWHVSGRWRLFGTFGYRRSWEEGVRWLLSERPETGLPYYFASPRSGDWELERYHIRGQVDYHLVPSILLGGAVDIHYHRGTRSSDPRASTTRFSSDYALYTGLTRGDFALLIYAGMGYGTRDNDLLYRGTDNDRPTRLDLMSYELMGYGMMRRTQQYHNRTIESDLFARSLGIQLQGTLWGATLWARIDYDRRQDSLRRSRTQNVELSLLSAYTTDRLRLTLGGRVAIAPTLDLHTQLRASYTDGRQWLVNILGGQRNYIYRSDELRWGTILSYRPTPQHQQTLGLSLGTRLEQRKDGPSEHRYEHRVYEGSLSLGEVRTLRSRYELSYTLEQAFILPQSQLSYPEAQRGLFTTEVAEPLARYYRVAQGGTALRLSLGRAFGAYQVACALGGQIYYALGGQDGVGTMRSRLEASLILRF